MASLAPFIPPQPPRTADWVPEWRSLYGERMRNTVYGWPEPAFDVFYRKRKIFNITVHIATHPDMVGRVLLDNKENYVRPGIARRLLSPVVGNGLLNAEGDDWRTQRRIVAPTFAPGAVAKLSGRIAHAADVQVAGWPATPQPIDMAGEATRLTMAIIADALFANDPRLKSGDATGHIENLLKAAGQARFLSLLGLSKFDPSAAMRRARVGRVYLRATLGRLVDERGPDGGADDFFGGLIRALYAALPPHEARERAVDNAVTFYVAGHETTANALAWSIYLLAAQPQMQDRVRTEVQQAIDGDPADLPDRTPYLRQVLDEAMRLYPPAPRFDREALADDQLGDARIERGDIVSLWPWVMHRHRKLWDNPDAFDPDRFAPDRKAALHRFQYIPFGGGPRVCVGARFAIIEAQIVLARWLATHRFAVPTGFSPYPVGSVTLRPRDGMPLTVSPL